MQMPSLRYLRTFQVAAKHLSFKDAAQELNVTASAVSHQIRNLETFLGVQLFERMTRSLQFTAAGEKYYEFLNSLFLRIESETHQLSMQYGRDILRLSVPPFFASEILLPKLSSFQIASADTDIRVITRPSAMTTHPAEADVSVLLGDSKWPDLVVQRLFGHKLVAACSEAYLDQHEIREHEDLHGKTLIVHDNRPHAWRTWAATIGIDQPVASQIVRSDSMSAVARAAQQGLGVALISWPIGRDWFRPQSLVRLFDEEVETDESFYLAYRHEDADRKEIVRLRDWFVSEFAGYS